MLKMGDERRMIHWAWLLLSFVIGTWVGMFLTALLKANNPDFFEDEEEEEDHG